MNSNKCNNEVCAATRYYVDNGDKFNSLEKELRKVSGSLFFFRTSSKRTKRKSKFISKEK